jgi:hypothetical protein
MAETCKITMYMEHSPVRHCCRRRRRRRCRRRCQSADTIVQSVGEQDVYFR